MLAIFLFMCAMLQNVRCGDYFVQLTSIPEEQKISPNQYLTDHLEFLKTELPQAHVYQVYWSLAEKLGFFGYCVSIDDAQTPILSMSKNIKGIEPIGILSVAEVDFSSMPSHKGIDQTLSPFRRNNMQNFEVNIDSYYSTENDARCVYEADMFTNMMEPPANITSVYNFSKPVFAYVLDTGIQSTHKSFHSQQVEHGFDFENRIPSPEVLPDEVFLHDPHGHGTQVAGLLQQVCSNTHLIDVRVLGEDGTGRIDNIVKGLEYVLDHYFANEGAKGRLHSLINLSFSGKSSNILRNVLYYISKMLLIVGASGDEDAFSCEVSPSNSEFILIAGAVTWSSSLPLSGTNYGSCVRVRAAADHVLVPYVGMGGGQGGGGGGGEMRVASGSSMASAFLAGVAARVISVLHATPGALEVLYSKHPGDGKEGGEVLINTLSGHNPKDNIININKEKFLQRQRQHNQTLSPREQRDLIEFLIEFLSTPRTHHDSSAHATPFTPCSLSSMPSIQDSLEQHLHLHLHKRPVQATSPGGRRALQGVKKRFKESQRQKLESNYE